MSRESDFATRMSGDATLMAILIGGVHRYEVTGQDGITRDTVPTAFDASGWLKPCALVKQASNIPDGWVNDFDTQIVSTNQRVEIWIYQDRSYNAIDAAALRICTLFQGHRFNDSFDVYLANDLDRQHDNGALSGASLRKLDWIVPSVTEF